MSWQFGTTDLRWTWCSHKVDLCFLSAGKQWCRGATRSPESNCRCSDSKVKHLTLFYVDACVPPLLHCLFSGFWTLLLAFAARSARLQPKDNRQWSSAEWSRSLQTWLGRWRWPPCEQPAENWKLGWFWGYYTVYRTCMYTKFWSRWIIVTHSSVLKLIFSMQEKESSLMWEHVVKLRKEVGYYDLSWFNHLVFQFLVLFLF